MNRLPTTHRTRHLQTPARSDFASTRRVLAIVAFGLSVTALQTASAQTTAAGEPLQQGVTPISPSQSDPQALPAFPPVQPSSEPAGAPTASFELRAIRFTGQRSLTDEDLQKIIGPVAGRRVTLGQLNMLADQVTARYRELGFPLARAIVPAQRIVDGIVTLEVIEGLIGKSTAVGDDPKVGGAQPFLDAGVPSGSPVRSSTLERSLLLLDDQPGFRVRPVLQPGAHRGETDLVAAIERRNHVSGEVALDNTGNISTGEYRTRAALNFNSPFMFGDKLSLNAMLTDESLRLGAVDYERPLGATGTRGGIGYARTSYILGGPFAALNTTGFSDTTTLRVSRSLLRSQRSNATASLMAQRKALTQNDGSVGALRNRWSELLTGALQFDHRDTWAGGGVTYGQFAFAAGHLTLDDATRITDAVTAQTEGGFRKAVLDVARIQRLGGAWSAYARLSTQWASKNLDPSEKFTLGGFLGVRAYPMGEGSGDSGSLMQAEVRRSFDPLTVFGFMDAGQVRVNTQPWSATSENTRQISGAGIGARWVDRRWSLESTVGWRIRGGTPQAEPRDRVPRVFVVLSYRFD